MAKTTSIQRWGGIVVGLGTHALFGVTVWFLFFFLRDLPAGFWAGTPSNTTASGVLVDVLLALQFAIPHSLLLHPAIRNRLTWIPTAFYGCVFTLATIASLWLAFLFWQHHPLVLWQATGWLATVIQASFLFSWVAMLYSISHTGFGWQTGWTPWLAWFRGQPHPRREFKPHGIYRVLRHPVYLSFAGLIWFSPIWTVDRAVLVGVWTVYIAIGSIFKDERLAYYLGATYRDYQRQVAGYPIIGFGPLGRLRDATPANEPAILPVAAAESKLDGVAS